MQPLPNPALKMIARLMVCLTGLLLMSCAALPVTSSACVGWEPICWHQGDKLSDKTAKQILSHLKHGASLTAVQSNNSFKLTLLHSHNFKSKIIVLLWPYSNAA